MILNLTKYAEKILVETLKEYCEDISREACTKYIGNTAQKIGKVIVQTYNDYDSRNTVYGPSVLDDFDYDLDLTNV